MACQAITSRTAWAQCPSPNDPRNGSNRRALTVLRESWVNDSCGCASGSTAATPPKRRAALASCESTAHNRSGVRCLEFPLRLPSASQASRNTYLTERHHVAKSGSRWERLDEWRCVVRDLNYAMKQLCRRNRDGSFATQAD